MHKQNNQTLTARKIKRSCPILSNLAEQCDHSMMVYILRSLYKEIIKAKKLKENKKQLIRRIKVFEKEYLVPGYLSSLPIDDLLLELEDAQYLYPIQKREISFPVFH